MAYVIAQPCVDVNDRQCVTGGPVDCIYEGTRSLSIPPDERVDCGACEPVCPVEAIYPEDDLPGHGVATSSTTPRSLRRPVRGRASISAHRVGPTGSVSSMWTHSLATQPEGAGP